MTKRSIVLLTAAILLAAFALATYIHQRTANANKPLTAPAIAKSEENTLIRAHSPVLGANNAPITIVEFFDPSCEACRAYFPHVEQILEQYPGKVRVVLRYAPFHKGSDEAIRILEAARLQGLFKPVLEALFAAQPLWAAHDAPNLDKAWDIAATRGLDVARGKSAPTPTETAAVLKQDMSDLQTLGVKGTPTFFVNGERLMSLELFRFKEIIASKLQNLEQSSAFQPNDADASTANANTVMIKDAFIPVMPEAAKTGLAYVTLTSAEDDKLISISSPRAESAAIHTTKMDDGVMRMRPVEDGVDLPAGSPVRLSAKAMHLMFMGVPNSFKIGENIPVTFNFAKAAPQTIEITVVPISTAEEP